MKGANSVKIIGPNLATLEQLASQAMRELDQVRGVTDLGIFRVLGQPNLNITVDRLRAARYGLNVNDINSVVQAALGGTVATTVLEAERQFGVAVRLAPEYRSQLDSIGRIKVGVAAGNGGNAYIPLSELATISLDTGASYIFRERNRRFVPIKFSVRGRDLAGAVEEAQKRISKNVKLPTGYRIEWAGEFEGLQSAQKRLAVIVPITLVLIMVLLYGMFNSLRDSLMALLGIPFAVCGGILGLYVAGLEFSISAAIGFISLFGVSVMSGILIITGYHRVGRERHAQDRRDVSRRRGTDAPDSDDGPVGLHRPASSRGLNRDRQSGPAAACDGRRRRHADRTDHAARGGTGPAEPVPGPRTQPAAGARRTCRRHRPGRCVRFGRIA